MCIRDRDRFIHETDPTIIGWKSLKKEQGIYEPSDNLFHDDARKFEIATSCIPLLAGLRNSLDLLDKDCHEKEKNKTIKKLSGKLWDELNQSNGVELVLEKKYLNGIVCFNIENIKDKGKFVKKLGEKKISIELKNNREDTYLLVDGAQTFGHINIEKEVFYSDLYSITSHKWACGPEGLGAIYVSDRFIHETDPTIIGWKSLKKEQGIYEPSDNLFHDDARKFEIATSCIPLLAGLRNSLDPVSYTHLTLPTKA